jgi:hypothetical protein
MKIFMIEFNPILCFLVGRKIIINQRVLGKGQIGNDFLTCNVVDNLHPNQYGMKVGLSFNKHWLLIFCILGFLPAKSQFLVDMIDTTDTGDKGLWAVFRKSDHLQVSGYIQPQFQAAQSKGVENFSGGDFAKNSNNRFMIRRGRARFDYAHFNHAGLPQAQVVLQFEGSEKGVAIRDFWGRYYENKLQLFSFTTGMFARPFGYEVNLGSGDRESIERGRMSQVLMRVERDLGAMVSFEPRKKNNPLRLLKFDAGVFNGQGLTGPEEYDSYKDFISRLSLKSYKISKNVSLTGGLSFFEGGLMQNSKYIYKMNDNGGVKHFQVDSSLANVGQKAPRKYRGLDAQLKISNKWGRTEFRGEYWWGTQSSSANQSLTPGTLQTDPYYIREFNGAFFYFLQNIVNDKHLLVLKYDIYDPNKKVKGKDIGVASTNTHSGDIKYNTFGAGYVYYVDDHFKIVLWYDMIKNEITDLNGYTSDIKDNIFTFRVQFKF